MNLLGSISQRRLSGFPRLAAVSAFANEAAELLPDAELAALCHETAVCEFAPLALASIGFDAHAARLRALRGAGRKAYQAACADIYDAVMAAKAGASGAERERIDDHGEVVRCALNSLSYGDANGSVPNFMQSLAALERVCAPGMLPTVFAFFAAAVRAPFVESGHALMRTDQGFSLLREDPDALRSFLGERDAVLAEVRVSERRRAHLMTAGGLRIADRPVELPLPLMWRRPETGILPIRVLFIGNFIGGDNDRCIEDERSFVVHPETLRRIEAMLRARNPEGKPSLWNDFPRTIERFDFSLPNLIVEILHASSNDLLSDIEDAPELKKTGLFRNLHTGNFGSAGGKPYTIAFVFTKTSPGDKISQYLNEVAAHCCLPMFINGRLDVADDGSLTRFHTLVESKGVTGHTLHRIPPAIGNALARHGAPLDLHQLTPEAAAWILAARVAQHIKVLHRHHIGTWTLPHVAESEINQWLAGLVGAEEDPAKPFAHAHIAIDPVLPDSIAVGFTLDLAIRSGVDGVTPRQVRIFGRLDRE